MNARKLVGSGLFMLLCLAEAAAAGDAASRGSAVVDQWCRECHLRMSDKPDDRMAPPFEEIVKRRGRNKAFFVRFLHEDHFPMPFYRLFEHEKADVIAYLMGLQRSTANE